MMYSYRVMFLLALLIAAFGETIILLLVSKIGKFEPKPLYKLLLAGSIPSVASLPWLWYVMPAFLPMTSINIIGTEILIAFCEALLIHLITGYSYRNSLILALAMNVVSYIIGILVF